MICSEDQDTRFTYKVRTPLRDEDILAEPDSLTVFMVQVRFGFSLTEAQTVSDGQDESPHKTTSTKGYRRVFHLCLTECVYRI